MNLFEGIVLINFVSAEWSLLGPNSVRSLTKKYLSGKFEDFTGKSAKWKKKKKKLLYSIK